MTMTTTTTKQEAERLILEADLRRLLDRMESYNPEDMSSYSLRGRAALAQQMWQTLQQPPELEQRLQAACWKAEQLAQKKQATERDWVKEIFFQPYNTTLETPEKQQDAEELMNEEEEDPETFVQQKKDKSVASHEPTTAHHRRDEKIEELQKAQRQQLEEEISHMAAQLKASTQKMNTTLEGQTQNLGDMEVLASDNVDKVTKAADRVQEHNRRAWTNTIATWTMWLTILATFAFCIITIRMAPKRKTSLPCLFWCSRTKTVQQRALERMDELKRDHKRKPRQQMEGLVFQDDDQQAQETAETQPLDELEAARQQVREQQEKRREEAKKRSEQARQHARREALNQPKVDVPSGPPTVYQEHEDDEQALKDAQLRLRQQAEAARKTAAEIAARNTNRKLDKKKVEETPPSLPPTAQPLDDKAPVTKEASEPDPGEAAKERYRQAQHRAREQLQDPSPPPTAQPRQEEECDLYSTCLKDDTDKKDTQDSVSQNVCEAGECTAKEETSEFGYEEVHGAAATGNLALLQRYLQIRPGFINHRDPNGWEVIHEAAYNGHVNVVNFLLQHESVDVNSRTGQARQGGSPLWWARHLAQDHPVIVALQAAGGRMYTPGEVDNKNAIVDFLSAAHGGNNRKLADLLDDAPSLIDGVDNNGWGAIHEAVRNQHIATVSFLAERGARLNLVTENGKGYSPLGMAVDLFGEESPIAKLLRRLGAPDIRPKKA